LGWNIKACQFIYVPAMTFGRLKPFEKAARQ
jgi:hypothetical protein